MPAQHAPAMPHLPPSIPSTARDSSGEARGADFAITKSLSKAEACLAWFENCAAASTGAAVPEPEVFHTPVSPQSSIWKDRCAHWKAGNMTDAHEVLYWPRGCNAQCEDRREMPISDIEDATRSDGRKDRPRAISFDDLSGVTEDIRQPAQLCIHSMEDGR